MYVRIPARTFLLHTREDGLDNVDTCRKRYTYCILEAAKLPGVSYYFHIAISLAVCEYVHGPPSMHPCISISSPPPPLGTKRLRE